MTALCAHLLVDRGLLDLDAPVARYWPEFAAAGKETIPVRMLLSHTAGLAAIRQRHVAGGALRLGSLRRRDRRRERRGGSPAPPTATTPLTFGHLVGEVIRRISGKSVGQFLRDEVTGPLGADFHIGLPASEERPLRRDGRADGRRERRGRPRRARARVAARQGARATRPLRPEQANTSAWRRAEIPAANGHGNARSVARVLAALACGGALDGVRLLRAESIDRAIETQAYDRDLVLGFKIKWGLGFMLASAELPLSPNPRAFGHGGWGGSLGFVDLDARVSWAYVMNKMAPGTAGDTRGFALMAALYGAL